MGVESRFADEFAERSRTVRPGNAPASDVLDDRGHTHARDAIPSVVRYRLLPGTAIAAIALTAPGFSLGAGDLGQAPDPWQPALVAPTQLVADAQRIRSVQLEPALASSPPLVSALDAPVAPQIEATPQAKVELATLSPAIDLSREIVTEAAFATAFATFEEGVGEAAVPRSTVLEPVNTPVEADPVLLAEIAVENTVSVGAAIPLALEKSLPDSVSAPGLVPLRETTPLPVTALTEDAIAKDRLTNLQLSAADLPVVEIVSLAPVGEALATTERAASSPVSRSPVIDRPQGPVVAAMPAPAPVPPVQRVATAPQLTALPAGRSATARTDALPIVVETPKAVPNPLAKPALPSAKADFATTIDPRRPASQPVSGTVSGLDLDIRSQLVTRIDGRVAGELDFKQTNQALSVRLGSIVELLRDRYDMSEFERITASSASEAYVTMAQLRGAGIPITYDPVYDEFNVGSRDHRPVNAHKVQIDQIGQPGVGTNRSGIGQVKP